MAADSEPAGASFERRREKWAQESADLTAAATPTDGSSPEATVRRYQRSRTAPVSLPSPRISPLRYDALSQRHHALSRRRALLLLLVPVLVVLGVVVDPVVAKVVAWALLLPLAVAVVRHTRALAQIEDERHVELRGGLADAWRDWCSARTELEAIDTASQARAALGANESRMESLVAALAQVDAAGRHDSAEHAASRAWVHTTAAKAVALTVAERQLATAVHDRTRAGELQVAPDGDTDALDRALTTARELTHDDDQQT